MSSLDAIVPLSLRTPFAVGRVNCYLLLGDPLTLVDTGPKSEAALSDLETGLADKGLSVEDLELILLTHQHADHVGLAHTLRERSGCAVAAQDLLARYMIDFDDATELEDIYQAEIMLAHGVSQDVVDTIRKEGQAHRRYAEPVTVDLRLEEGASIEAAGRTLEALQRPGHSPTDTIYLDRPEMIAFVGDHLLGRISSNPIVHRPLDSAVESGRRTSSLLAYRHSLKETAATGLKKAYPGHGELIDRPGRLIAERLDEQRIRNGEVLAALGAGARTAHEVACVIWGGVALRQVYLTLSEVIGACDMLVAEGRIVEYETGAPEPGTRPKIHYTVA